jgi:hypothetical protein
MSKMSDLHLHLSELERMMGELDEQQEQDFINAYVKGRLPHQQKRKMERFPADDEQPQPQPHARS